LIFNNYLVQDTKNKTGTIGFFSIDLIIVQFEFELDGLSYPLKTMRRKVANMFGIIVISLNPRGNKIALAYVRHRKGDPEIIKQSVKIGSARQIENNFLKLLYLARSKQKDQPLTPRPDLN
jgi:hypothetical protein